MTITVLGLPATQGSKTGRPFRRGDGSLGVVMTEGKTKKQAEHLHSWRGMIASAASLELLAQGEKILDGPVVLEATFYLPRPASAKRKAYPDTRPDVDKLTRAIFDALSGVAYADDSRIVDCIVKKRFADFWEHNRPGATIRVLAKMDEAYAKRFS